jgi:RsiW-degrading membrane proteinase PrsW (M82 family)
MRINWAVALMLPLFQLAFASDYESELTGGLVSLLSSVGIILVGLLFVLVIAILFMRALESKRKVGWGPNMLLDRKLLLFEIFFAVLVAYFSLTEFEMGRAVLLVYLIAGVVAFLPLGIFMAISFMAQEVRKGIYWNMMALVLWGLFAGAAALVFNQTVLGLTGGFDPLLAELVVLVLFAPLFEEGFKGWALAMLARSNVDVDKTLGMLYGFAIGAGFAAIENWIYFTSPVTSPLVLGVEGWTRILLYRSFFVSISHGFFTAALAGTIFETKGSVRRRYALGLIVAFTLHALFNYLPLSGTFEFAQPFYVLFMTMGFVYVAYTRMRVLQ